MIAGEWGVLEPPNPCIVTAINKRVFVEVETSQKIEIEMEDFNLKASGTVHNDGHLRFDQKMSSSNLDLVKFVKTAIEIFNQYTGGIKPLRIRTWCDQVGEKRTNKVSSIGFGSSGASVAAIIAALLKFHGEEIQTFKAREKIYKLAMITHYLAQLKVGSGFDVAASTYGGVIAYRRPDPIWLVKKMYGAKDKELKKLIDTKWPFLEIKPLNVPNKLQLTVAWTRKKNSTSQMIKKVYDWKNNGHQKEYKQICNQIGSLVHQLIIAWRSEDVDQILNLLKKDELLLRELGIKSGVEIETKELHLLSKIAGKLGAAGKLSGAGGGDCGIAVSFDNKTYQKIRDSYTKKGLKVLDVNIDFQGIKEYSV